MVAALVPDRSNEVPVPLTPLIGREREVAAVRALLAPDGARLVTLTGPGGVGKTRLALRVAAELAGAFGDGVRFVPLAAIRDPALVAPTVAQAVGVREVGERSVIEGLIALLQEQELLLVLDNFEQVLEAAPLVADLLTACPRLTILVTSRASLRLQGEQEFPVPPLAVPDRPEGLSLAELGTSEAVALFLQRARAARPGFALTEENCLAVAEICRRLDGLPLAIELAAAWVKLLPPAALLTRLGYRLELLTGGARNLPERLRTMRGAIAWSYDFLDAGEQRLFRLLSVFVGGCTLDAVERVMGDRGWGMGDGEPDTSSPSPITHHPSPAVLDLVAALVDKSLLRQVDGPDADTPRFAMLETIHDFSFERLVESGEVDRVRRAHAAWYLTLAEEARRHSEGADQAIWFDRLEADHDNLRVALGWAAEHDPESMLRLVAALWRFWVVRGHLAEGRGWLERALAVGDGSYSAARAEALYGGSVFADVTEDEVRSAALAEELRASAREHGDDAGVGQALNLLGNVALKRHEVARAKAFYEEAFALLRAPDDDPWIAVVLDNLGTIAHLEGNHALAAARLGEALALWRRLGNQWGIAVALMDLGDLALIQGDDAQATALFRESLLLNAAQRDQTGIAWGLERFAIIAARRGDATRAARLFGSADHLSRLLCLRHPDLAAEHHAGLTTARDLLGEDAFTAAWDAGQALPLAEAIAEAAAVGDAPWADQLQPPPAAPDHGLTDRQLEVLRLLADGRSDREIAAALFISHRTAMTHVAHILDRLGVASRAAAVAYAYQHGLI